MENLNIEKAEKAPFEDFMQTVKTVDMEEMARLKKPFYDLKRDKEDLPRFLANQHEFSRWKNLAVFIEPNIKKSRLYHFLLSSSCPVGDCEFDDVEGDCSVAAFLRADKKGKEEILEKLDAEYKKKLSEQAKNFKK